MDYLNLDVALAQLLAYFVSEKGYTIVSVQQDRDDLWLIQPKNRSFPILRLCRESREELRQTKLSASGEPGDLRSHHQESKVIVVNGSARRASRMKSADSLLRTMICVRAGPRCARTAAWWRRAGGTGGLSRHMENAAACGAPSPPFSPRRWRCSSW
ncbi:MAG: hypothetical protein ACLTCB_01920 [Merdibacter sp.]